MFKLNPARSPIAAAELVMHMQRPDIFVKKCELGVDTGNDTVVLINNVDWRFSICKSFPLYVALRGTYSGTHEGFMFAQTDQGIKLIPHSSALVSPIRPAGFYELKRLQEVIYIVGEFATLLIARAYVRGIPEKNAHTPKGRGKVRIINVLAKGSKAAKLSTGNDIETTAANLISLSPEMQ